MTTRNLLACAISAAIATAACAADNGETLDTIFIKTQRGYSADATETNRDYSAFAATVGTKIPATPREIPQSISIITSQQIKDRNVETLDQLARKTPGLRVLSNDDGRSSIYARGYEYDEYNVNGLPAQMQSINGTLPNLAAFDRVEVMRGPSGLFDSSGEMGGLVNLVRKRPGEDFDASASAGYGTEKQYKLGGDITGKLNADGTVRGRVLAETTGKSPKPAKKNNHHETAYAALDWDINPDTTAGVGYLYQQRHITPDNGLPAWKNGKLLPLPQKTFTGADWNHFDMQSHDVFADLEHYFANDAYGKIGLRYSDRDAKSNYAFAGSALNDQLQITPTGLGTNIKQNALAFDASYSQPFNWGGMRSEYVVGADYNHFKTKNEQGRARALGGETDYRALGSLPYTNVLDKARSGAKGFARSLSKQTLDEAGAYGKLVVRPREDLALIGGGRIGHYQLRSGDGKSQEKRHGTPVTGYAGIVWDFSKTDSLYASYSSLYRPQTEVDKNDRLLKPRRGDQIEIGHKGSYLDDRLNTRVSLYRLQDKNAAASIAGDNNHYTALGKRVMQGVELEASGALTDQWRIHAGYSYLSPKIKTASTTRDAGIFLLMPRHSANLWTTYDIGNATIGGGVNAMSGIKSSQGVRGGGYATFDLMAAYRITPQLNLQMNVDNLFDRKYYTRVGSTNTFNIPGAERSIMATLRYDFK